MASSDVVAPPSGEQHLIERDRHRVVVTEVGATLRSYSVDGIDVLDGFDRGEMSSAGRGQVLAPWPNRLEDGSYRFGDREGRAALDEPERGNAIHGLVRWLPWRSVSRTDAELVLGCDLYSQPAYPWRLELEVTYRITDEGLSVDSRATNLSEVAAPFGIGFHPYLTVGTGTIDEADVSIPARRRLLTDERGLPTGDETVSGSAFDLSNARSVQGVTLDTAFSDLIRSGDGRAEATLANPHDGRWVTVWIDEAFRYLMVYTGDTLEPAGRRRRGIAIEPMTCPPNAFRSGVDVIRLEPGGSWRGRWGISVEEGS